MLLPTVLWESVFSFLMGPRLCTLEYEPPCTGCGEHWLATLPTVNSSFHKVCYRLRRRAAQQTLLQFRRHVDTLRTTMAQQRRARRQLSQKERQRLDADFEKQFTIVLDPVPDVPVGQKAAALRRMNELVHLGASGDKLAYTGRMPGADLDGYGDCLRFVPQALRVPSAQDSDTWTWHRRMCHFALDCPLSELEKVQGAESGSILEAQQHNAIVVEAFKLTASSGYCILERRWRQHTAGTMNLVTLYKGWMRSSDPLSSHVAALSALELLRHEVLVATALAQSIIPAYTFQYGMLQWWPDYLEEFIRQLWKDMTSVLQGNGGCMQRPVAVRARCSFLRWMALTSGAFAKEPGWTTPVYVVLWPDTTGLGRALNFYGRNQVVGWPYERLNQRTIPTQDVKTGATHSYTCLAPVVFPGCAIVRAPPLPRAQTRASAKAKSLVVQLMLSWLLKTAVPEAQQPVRPRRRHSWSAPVFSREVEETKHDRTAGEESKDTSEDTAPGKRRRRTSCAAVLGSGPASARRTAHKSSSVRAPSALQVLTAVLQVDHAQLSRAKQMLNGWLSHPMCRSLFSHVFLSSPGRIAHVMVEFPALPWAFVEKRQPALLRQLLLRMPAACRWALWRVRNHCGRTLLQCASACSGPNRRMLQLLHPPVIHARASV